MLRAEVTHSNTVALQGYDWSPQLRHTVSRDASPFDALCWEARASQLNSQFLDRRLWHVPGGNESIDP